MLDYKNNAELPPPGHIKSMQRPLYALDQLAGWPMLVKGGYLFIHAQEAIPVEPLR